MLKFATGMLAMALIGILTKQFLWQPQLAPSLVTNVPAEIQLDVPFDVPEISAELAERLIGRAEHVSFTKVTTMSPQVAAILSKHPANLSFPAMTELTPEVADSLVRDKDGLWIALVGLKEVSPELAKSLAKARCALDLSGVNQLSPQSAEFLAMGKGAIKLGLQSITPQVATKLAKHESWLSLDAVRTIDFGSAVELAKHRGWLSLSSLAEVTPEVAGAFGNFNGDKLELGLTSLNLETATALANARCRSGLYLNRLQSVHPQFVEVLAKGHEVLSLQGLELHDPVKEKALQEVFEGLRADGKILLLPNRNSQAVARTKLPPSLSIVAQSSQGSEARGRTLTHEWTLQGQSVGRVIMRVLHLEGGKSRVISECAFQGGKDEQQTIKIELQVENLDIPSGNNIKLLKPTLSVEVNGLQSKSHSVDTIPFDGSMGGQGLTIQGQLQPVHVLAHSAHLPEGIRYSPTLDSMLAASQHGSFLVTVVEWCSVRDEKQASKEDIPSEKDMVIRLLEVELDFIRKVLDHPDDHGYFGDFTAEQLVAARRSIEAKSAALAALKSKLREERDSSNSQDSAMVK